MCCVIIYAYSGEKREFNAGQFFADLFTVGLEAVAFGGAAKGLRNAETASWCFVAGTLIATEDEQMPIYHIMDLIGMEIGQQAQMYLTLGGKLVEKIVLLVIFFLTMCLLEGTMHILI